MLRHIVYLAAALILFSIPAEAFDRSVAKIITVVAGAKVADEECPTGGKQQMAWGAIGNFLSEEWAATDFDDKVAEMADKLRPKVRRSTREVVLWLQAHSSNQTSGNRADAGLSIEQIHQIPRLHAS